MYSTDGKTHVEREDPYFAARGCRLGRWAAEAAAGVAAGRDIERGGRRGRALVLAGRPERCVQRNGRAVGERRRGGRRLWYLGWNGGSPLAARRKLWPEPDALIELTPLAERGVSGGLRKATAASRASAAARSPPACGAARSRAETRRVATPGPGTVHPARRSDPAPRSLLRARLVRERALQERLAPAHDDLRLGASPGSPPWPASSCARILRARDACCAASSGPSQARLAPSPAPLRGGAPRTRPQRPSARRTPSAAPAAPRDARPPRARPEPLRLGDRFVGPRLGLAQTLAQSVHERARARARVLRRRRRARHCPRGAPPAPARASASGPRPRRAPSASPTPPRGARPCGLRARAGRRQAARRGLEAQTPPRPRRRISNFEFPNVRPPRIPRSPPRRRDAAAVAFAVAAFAVDPEHRRRALRLGRPRLERRRALRRGPQPRLERLPLRPLPIRLRGARRPPSRPVAQPRRAERGPPRPLVPAPRPPRSRRPARAASRARSPLSAPRSPRVAPRSPSASPPARHNASPARPPPPRAAPPPPRPSPPAFAPPRARP